MCREYHATCTLLKSNTSLGWEDLSFVGSARGPSAWVTHPHPPLRLLTVPAICRLPLAHDSLLLYSASTPASRLPPTPLLTGPPRLLCLLEGELFDHPNWKPLPHISYCSIGVCPAMGTPLLQALPSGRAGACVSGYPPPCWPALTTGH